jgi:hypothetical protein
MIPRQQDLWRWLEAEDAGGDWESADATFAAVASRWLPLMDAPAGLTERIMAAMPRTADTPWARMLAGLLASWWVRGAVSVAMLVLGIAATAVALGQFITIGSVLTAIAAGGHAVLDAVSTTWDGCLAAWPVVVSLGQTAAMLTATRTAAFVVLINLALAMGAFAGLTRLLAVTEEES